MGQGLSTSLVALASRARETVKPSLASASACLRLAGVIRFRVPNSSSLPQRPQFESSVCQRAYSACVTRGCGVACCACARPPGNASVATMTPVRTRVELPTISVLITTFKNASSSPQSQHGRAIMIQNLRDVRLLQSGVRYVADRVLIQLAGFVREIGPQND